MGLKRLLFNVGTGPYLYLDLRPDLVGHFAVDDGLMFLVVECKPKSIGTNAEDAYVCLFTFYRVCKCDAAPEKSEALVVTLLCVMCSILLPLACHSIGCRSKLGVLSVAAMLHFAWALDQGKCQVAHAANVLVVARNRHVNYVGADISDYELYFFDVRGLTDLSVTYDILCHRIRRCQLWGAWKHE